MNINIRCVNPSEADVLSDIAFSAKAHWGYPQRWMEIWRSQLTFSPDYFEEIKGWVADNDGSQIAFCTLEEKNDNAWIENLWVLPEYMGVSIGERLFTQALSRARELGYSKLQLVSDPNAIGFYEKMGMKKIGEINFPIEGQDRILPVMEMKL